MSEKVFIEAVEEQRNHKHGENGEANQPCVVEEI